MKHECPVATKTKLASFNIKVTVKVIRSLAMVSFERVSLVEFACQIRSVYLLHFKLYANG